MLNIELRLSLGPMESKDSPSKREVAVGNSWIYEITEGSTRPGRKLTWKVRQVENVEKGTAFTIWETPNSGDEGMQLLLTKDGLQDVPTGFYLVSFPALAGKKWKYEFDSVKQGRKATVQFKIISVASPCSSGKYSFKDCLVVEQVDPDVGLDSIMYYARGVGPIKHIYKPLGSFEAGNIQTLQLQSYKVGPKVKRKVAED